MLPLAAIEDFLWWFNILCAVLAVVRIRFARLDRVYPWLFLYLVFRALRSGGLRLLDTSGNAYAAVWLLTEPVAWLFWGFLILEITSIALRDYQGLASFSRKTLIAGLVVCLLGSVATLLVDWTQSKGDFPVLLGVNLARRALYSAVSLYLLLLAAFLLWFPIPVTRNLLLHSMTLALSSVTGTAMVLIRNVFGPAVIPEVSVALMLVGGLCLLGWMGLSPAGERRPAPLRIHWRPESEGYFLEQLAALNKSLVRTGREMKG